MKRLLFSALFFFSFGFLCAQNAKISGTIKDQRNNTPVEGASVLLYQASDSSLVKAEVSNDQGVFSLDDLAAGDYFIEVSFIGFNQYRSEKIVTVAAQNVDLGTIVLSGAAQTLQGVVVSATRPLVERKTDKLVFNVGSSLSAASSSALEMLEKAPGVTVDKDGNISLRGKSGVVVLIDDRPTYMSNADLANYLKGIPASSLDQLEIMTNPSARYDAAGNSGIINIKTKKTKSSGLNGSVSSALKYTDRMGGSGNLNLNYRNGKYNLFGNYAHTSENYTRNQNIIRYFNEGGSKDVVSSFDQKSEQPGNYKNDNLKLGMDYYAGNKTIVGVVFSGFRSRNNDVISSESWFRDPAGDRDSGLRAYNNIRGKTNNFSTNLNLRHTFDSTGKKMTVDLDYISYDKPQTTTVLTDYFLADDAAQKPSVLLFGNTPSVIKIYSGKVDFTLPFGTFGKIETGLKASNVSTDNDARYTNTIGDHSEIDYGKSNHFIYKESIVAGYLSWSRQIKRWGLQAGLRAENTYSSGHQLGNAVVSDSSFTKNYLNFFPTAYLSFNANDNNVLGLNFGRRIQRPNYGNLNPFIYFIDEYTYFAGNVFLQPQFTNQVELSYSFKSFLQASAAYSHTSDVITQILRQDTAKRIIYQTNDNLASQTGFTFSTGVNFRTGKILRTNIDMVLDHQRYKGQVSAGYPINSAKWMFTGKLTEQATLGKGWSAEVSGFYLSPQLDGQGYIDRMWRADGTIQKKILKEKGNIGLTVRDIFSSQKAVFSIHDNSMHLVSTNNWPTPTFSLSFKYSFGKPIKGLNRYNSGGAGDEQNRVGG